MKKILTVLMTMILLVQPVLAEDIYFDKYCESDNVTLVKVKNVTINVPTRNRTNVITVTDPITCEYGCQNNECLESGSKQMFWAFVLIIVMAVLYIIFKPR